MMPLVVWALAACLAPDPASDFIRAADLAPAFAAMASLAPDTPLLPAPVPGAVRVLHAPELRRLAARFQLAGAPDRDLCVARPVARLDESRLLEAMRHGLPAARLEILEFSHQPAPEGAIEFPVSGLHAGAREAFWTGDVRYAGNRRFAIWARVKVSFSVTRVVARADLPTGRAIDAAQVALETSEQPFGGPSWARSVEEVAGQWPRQLIRAGDAIRRGQLEAPQAVVRGETVEVDVRTEGAHLKLEARAEGSGTIGDLIPVRNPSSQKRFLARIQAPGRVSVDSDDTGKGTP